MKKKKKKTTTEERNGKYIVLQNNKLCDRASTKRLWDEKQQKKISHSTIHKWQREMACVHSFYTSEGDADTERQRDRDASGAQSHQIHFS